VLVQLKRPREVMNVSVYIPVGLGPAVGLRVACQRRIPRAGFITVMSTTLSIITLRPLFGPGV
jgi:hypothetical protein